MPRFAANLTLLYTEHDFLDRFSAAASDGFSAVEYLFPFAYKAQDLNQRLQDNGLQQVLINAPSGDWDNGERGIACLPGRESEFQTGFLKALEYAATLNCPRIHVLAGLKPTNISLQAVKDKYLQNLSWACHQAKSAGVDVLIEPINTRDMPGFYLNYQAQAHDVVMQVGAKNLKVQMDLYHCQIMEGDLETKIRHYLPTGRVGHFQIAGVPQRHEPNVGELNAQHLFNVIDEVASACGWQGWIGCEYHPARGSAPNGTRDGLGWKPGVQTRLTYQALS